MTPIPLKQQMWLPILKNRVNQDFTDIKELIEITENNLNREVEHLTKEINCHHRTTSQPFFYDGVVYK